MSRALVEASLSDIPAAATKLAHTLDFKPVLGMCMRSSLLRKDSERHRAPSEAMTGNAKSRRHGMRSDAESVRLWRDGVWC